MDAGGRAMARHVFVGLEVSSTGLVEEQRAQVKAMVHEGGGMYSGSFSKTTNVLVATSVGSDKYRAALEWGVAVVRPEWVIDCVSSGTPLKVEEYRVGAFHGLTVCVTGFPPETRQWIMDTVKEHGGQYSGSLVRYTTTHLVAESTTGEKCRAASKWNQEDSARLEGDLAQAARHGNAALPTAVNPMPAVKIVSLEWVRACVKALHWVDESSFAVCSPSPQAAAAARKSAELSKVKEDLAAERRQREAELQKQQALQEERERQLRDQMDKELAALEELQKSGAFHDMLETCSIFLLGFDVKRWRTVLTLVRATGATVYWEWNRHVTHVLAGNMPNKDYVGELRNANPDLVFIDMDFILTCLKTGKRPARKRRVRPVLQSTIVPQSSKGNGSDGARDSGAQPPRHKSMRQHRVEAAPVTSAALEGANKLDMDKFIVNLGKENRRAKTRAAPARLKPQHLAPRNDFANALICVSRYTDQDRAKVQKTALQLGAKFTDRLTAREPRVTHLISKDHSGEKVARAKQWRIPVHNLEWLEQQLYLHERAQQAAARPRSSPQAERAGPAGADMAV